MAGPLDYLRWRGDLSFKQKQYNSVDGAILASIAYLPFDGSIVGHSLKEACERILALYSGSLDLHRKTETRLLVKSPRFADLKILDWTSRLEAEPAPLQFAALTLQLDENTILISFRGTDSSVVGWNEDMIMNYSYQIYGQTVARDYLEAMADKFKNCKIYITGHSKGGHYAIHSLAAARYDVQDRVISALSFDGPGYRSVFAESTGFKRAIDKMRTYVPESSVFGIMLDHPERTLVVKSSRPTIIRISCSLETLFISSVPMYWPSLIMVILSATRYSSSSLWDIKITPIPFAAISLTSFTRLVTSFSFREEVGSSMIRIFISVLSAFATSINCFSITDSSPMGRVTSICSPTFSSSFPASAFVFFQSTKWNLL